MHSHKTTRVDLQQHFKWILFNNIRKAAWREWIDSIFSTTLENGLLSQRPSFCQNKTIICNDFETLLPNSTTQETLPPLVMGKLYLKAPFTWAWSKAFLASSILYLERAAMYMDGTKNMIDWPWNARLIEKSDGKTIKTMKFTPRRSQRQTTFTIDLIAED